MIGQAQTGTGKTAAFGLPLLQYLDPDSEETQAIVLTPTRELCIQVTQALRAYAEHLDIEVVAVFGGAPIATQQSRLRARRPGRRRHRRADDGPDLAPLAGAHLGPLRRPRRGRRDARPRLHRGRREDPAHVPVGRQTALFSATMPAPIARLAEQYMYEPVTIKVTPKQLTVDAIEQAYVEVEPREKTDRLIEVLQGRGARAGDHLLPHEDRRRAARQAARRPRAAGQGAARRHEPGPARRRDDLVQGAQACRCWSPPTSPPAGSTSSTSPTSSTTTCPNNTEIYVHRIGRTGRVGRTGPGDHLRDPEAARRDPADRARGEDRDRRVGAARGAHRARAAPAPPRPLAESARGASARAAGRADGHVKLFVNRGARSGIDEDDLRWALTEGAVIPDDEIGGIRGAGALLVRRAPATSRRSWRSSASTARSSRASRSASSTRRTSAHPVSAGSASAGSASA